MKQETELAKKVVSWLKDSKWEVWQEVKLSSYICPIHDIIAVKHNITWCIECKLSLNLKVIEQAYRSNTIFKSVAVPNARANSFGRLLCNKLGIGILTVTDSCSGDVYEYPGEVYRHNYSNSKLIIENLKNIPQNFSEAGSKGSYWSPYKNTIKGVKNFIYSNPGCSFKEIMDNLKDHHFASTASARSCLQKDLIMYEKSWCKIEDGKYYVI